MSWVQLLLATAAVTIGATLQGSIGFGLGLFSVPFLLLIEPQLIPGPLLLSAVSLTLLLAHRERRAIDLPVLTWAVLGRLLGVTGAAVALTLLSDRTLGITFGVLVLAAVAMSASGLHIRVSPTSLLGAGTLSGFMATTASIGGPPIALLLQRESGPRIRGTLSAFFLIGVAMSLVGLAIVGRFGIGEVLLAVTLVPGILLGFLFSRHVARTLDRGYIRASVLMISAAAGLVVLLRHVL